MRLLKDIWRLNDALNYVKPQLAICSGATDVPLLQGVGHVLGRDMFAGESVPHFDRSTMDGYAVRAGSTLGASEAMPAMLTLGANEVDSCLPVLTGGHIAAGFDAVVMSEYAEQLDDGTVLVYRPVAEGENLMTVGEDITCGTHLFEAGKLITARDVAVLAALGVTEVPVRDFKVAVLSSGNEVIPISVTPSLGQVRDINSHLLIGLVRSMGLSADFLGIIPDNEALLSSALKHSLEDYDAVLISGGSSAGSCDFTSVAINGVASPGVLVHGLSIKPGKPTIIGICQGKLVLGLPGHPLSCAVVAHVLAIPLLAHASHVSMPEFTTIRLPLLRSLPSAPGRRDYVPVRVEQSGVRPLMAKSAAIRVMAESHGYIEIAEECEGLNTGEMVDVHIWR